MATWNNVYSNFVQKFTTDRHTRPFLERKTSVVHLLCPASQQRCHGWTEGAIATGRQNLERFKFWSRNIHIHIYVIYIQVCMYVCMYVCKNSLHVPTPEELYRAKTFVQTCSKQVVHIIVVLLLPSKYLTCIYIYIQIFKYTYISRRPLQYFVISNCR